MHSWKSRGLWLIVWVCGIGLFASGVWPSGGTCRWLGADEMHELARGGAPDCTDHLNVTPCLDPSQVCPGLSQGQCNGTACSGCSYIPVADQSCGPRLSQVFVNR
jgi:hypothetical protein